MERRDRAGGGGRRRPRARRPGCLRGHLLLRYLPPLPRRRHQSLRDVRPARLHARGWLRRGRARAPARRAPAAGERLARRGGYGIREAELELARRLGASETVDVSGGTATHEGELDLVVETAGAVAAVELATRLPREGGRIVALGIAGGGRELRVPADRFALRDLALIGSVGYTTAVWTRVVELLGAGLVDLEPVVARRIPAERFEDAFRLMGEADGVVGRILLEHT